MRRYRGSFRSFFVLLFVLLVSCAVFLGVNAWSPSKQAKSSFRILNKTRACDAVDITKRNGHIRISLKNGYNKSITAYVVSVGNDFNYKEEFIYSEVDSSIAPGIVYEQVIPIPSSQTNKSDLDVGVLAVLLEDKTSDGDQEAIAEIEEERLGEKIQLTRVLPVLKGLLELADMDLSETFNKPLDPQVTSLLDAPETDTLNALNRLGPRIGAMNEARIPQQVTNGIHTAKEAILRKLHDIQSQQTTTSVTLRQRLIVLREHYKKVIARL